MKKGEVTMIEAMLILLILLSNTVIPMWIALHVFKKRRTYGMSIS